MSKRNVSVRWTFRWTNLGFLKRLRGGIWSFFGTNVHYKTFLSHRYGSKKALKIDVNHLYERHLTRKEVQKSVWGEYFGVFIDAVAIGSAGLFYHIEDVLGMVFIPWC